jgi:hypothetical protein
VSFETTTFIFDRSGKYLGREYMSRDECDYFTPRTDDWIGRIQRADPNE